MEEFRALYQCFFPFGNSKGFADIVFEALSKPTGSVDIESFLKTLSIVIRGDLDQKVECKYLVDPH